MIIIRIVEVLNLSSNSYEFSHLDFLNSFHEERRFKVRNTQTAYPDQDNLRHLTQLSFPLDLLMSIILSS